MTTLRHPQSTRSKITRRQALKAGLAVAAAGSLHRLGPIARGALPDRRPNLILLVTDDQRADSMSCAGNAILRTPSIDALAEDGIRFCNSFATSAICMSSRASILTGLYTRQHGIDDFRSVLDRSLFKESYPALLRRAGYITGFVGKWGIDGGAMPVDDYDYFKGYQGQGAYFNPKDGRHLTTIQADQAIDFLKNCTGQQPFCLAVSFKAPHVQDEGRNMPGIYPKYPYDRALESLYAEAIVPGIVTQDQTPLPACLTGTLNLTREAPDFSPPNYQETMKDLYRLITGVDQAVGRIVAELKSKGLADNTVILYTADHGSFYGEHGFGGKWLMHEESIRTPFILHDPRLPANVRGTTRNQMVLNIDVPATLLELAGIAPPIGMQGRSVLPMLTDSKQPGRTEWFYENHFRNNPRGPIAASEGIRTTDWKYIRYIDTQPAIEQLFDLKTDPREERNLADDPDHQPRLLAMRARWQAWNNTLDAHSPEVRWSEPAGS
jgi:arylsulfatase A-like enzyme